MFRWFVLFLTPLVAFADERWIEIRSGPFQVLSNAGDRPARDVLNELEQVRYLVGQALGKDDLKTVWPVRVLVFKGAQSAVPPALTRDTYTASLGAGNAIPPAWLRQCVRLLMDANSGRMPPGIESGIESFYSTAQAVGTKITLGAPPPPAERNLDWARIHLLVTNENYTGRLRVLLYNLQRGADLEPSFKNGFSKSLADIDKQAGDNLKSGNFATVTVGGKPLNPQRDFHVQDADAKLSAIAQADLRLNMPGTGAQPAFKALTSTAPAEAHEGLGLVALQARQNEEARKEFQAAIDAGTKSAHAWLEAARLNPEPAKAQAQLQKAAELNANWAEPYAVLASIETDPSRRLQWFKNATQRDPRNAAYWRGVAELYQTHNMYGEAAKAWAAAETAAVDDAERDSIREARRNIEEKRLDYEAAERKRIEDEKQRDLQRVKDASMAAIHAAEERANRGQQRANPGGKVEQMEIGKGAEGKVHGRVSQIDCLGRMARLVIQPESGKPVKLLVRDPKTVVVLTGGLLELKCGVQKPARMVSIEYQPHADPKLATAGDVLAVSYE